MRYHAKLLLATLGLCVALFAVSGISVQNLGVNKANGRTITIFKPVFTPTPTPSPTQSAGSSVTYVGNGKVCNGTTIQCTSPNSCIEWSQDLQGNVIKKCVIDYPINICASPSTPFGNSGNPIYCPSGKVCQDYNSGFTCVPKGSDHAACNSNADCISGLYCDAIPIGGALIGSNTLYAIGTGVCHSLNGPNGIADPNSYGCDIPFNIKCQSGYKCSSQTNGGTCQAIKPGETCAAPVNGQPSHTCGIDETNDATHGQAMSCVQVGNNPGSANGKGGSPIWACEPPGYDTTPYPSPTPFQPTCKKYSSQDSCQANPCDANKGQIPALGTCGTNGSFMANTYCCGQL